MITPGQKIDLGLTLHAVDDGVAKEVSLGDLVRRRTIVSVYMRNNTPSCDRQNDSLVEHAAQFHRAGYDLIAISRDSCASHAKYAVKKSIGYTLVSDPDDRFAQATESLVEKSMYGKKFIGPARAAYVIAPDGGILAVVEKVDTADHAAQLLEVIRKL